MTITTDQAVQRAQEVGATSCHGKTLSEFVINSEELTALCNKVKRDTLLEAAVEFDRMAHGVAGAGVFPEKLRRMAGEE